MLKKIMLGKTLVISFMLIFGFSQVQAESKKKYVRKKVDLPMRKYNPETQELLEDEHKSYKKVEVNDSMSNGEKIFVSKGCNLCHDRISSKLGPSLKKIRRYYKNKQEDLVLYFQRKGKPIINRSRADMMKSQFTKLTILSKTQQNELATYMITGWKK